VTAAVIDMHQAYVDHFNGTSSAVTYINVAGFTSRKKRAHLARWLGPTRVDVNVIHVALCEEVLEDLDLSSDEVRRLREWCRGIAQKKRSGATQPNGSSALY